MAQTNTLNVEAIIRTNQPSIDRVAMITAKIPDAMSSVLFADSGATMHFFKSRSVFMEYKEVSNAIGISAKEGTGFSIAGSGNVSIRVVHNGEQNTLTFQDALHAPDISVNLVSKSRLDRLGWTVIFGGRKVRFCDPNGNQQFEGVENRGLYLVSGSFISNIPTAIVACLLHSPVPMSIMHRRFSHAYK